MRQEKSMLKIDNNDSLWKVSRCLERENMIHDRTNPTQAWNLLIRVNLSRGPWNGLYTWNFFFEFLSISVVDWRISIRAHFRDVNPCILRLTLSLFELDRFLLKIDRLRLRPHTLRRGRFTVPFAAACAYISRVPEHDIMLWDCVSSFILLSFRSHILRLRSLMYWKTSHFIISIDCYIRPGVALLILNLRNSRTWESEIRDFLLFVGIWDVDYGSHWRLTKYAHRPVSSPALDRSLLSCELGISLLS